MQDVDTGEDSVELCFGRTGEDSVEPFLGEDSAKPFLQISSGICIHAFECNLGIIA